MSKPLSFGKIDVNMRAVIDSSEGVPEPETPFRVALLGDFSNRAGRDAVEPTPNLTPWLLAEPDAAPAWATQLTTFPASDQGKTQVYFQVNVPPSLEKLASALSASPTQIIP